MTHCLPITLSIDYIKYGLSLTVIENDSNNQSTYLVVQLFPQLGLFAFNNQSTRTNLRLLHGFYLLRHH